MAEGGPSVADPEARGASRAERDAARGRRVDAGRSSAGGRRPGARERPPPPWGRFPLTELVVLLGIGLCVGGFVVGVEEARGRTMFLAGIVLGALGGLETSVRDHFAGYRSHSTLLAGFLAFIVVVAITFALGALTPSLSGTGAFAAALVAGGVVFGIAFVLLRRTFQRRSGGLSFR